MKPVKKASEPERAGSRSYLLAGVAVVILAIAIICFVFFPPAPANAGDEGAGAASSGAAGAGALYDKSVDLANAGKFEQALEAADQALALNNTMYTSLLQSNRAGILVMLGRNADAITAADAALAIQGNLTVSHSIAWFNKGNALKNLGRIDEARSAYANASLLDPSLKFPI
ncbi:MAG: tetratricopeptide repeat protein [Methanoregula sp.]|nr:tetratricopeptide repeat protein [Methanoregula sp.]